MPSCWLMKAEPDSRIEKGKDVRFSVDDFESAETTAWEGVRNHQAKNFMKAMEIGDKVLFYHSNCKTPGIAGFAEVSKLAYPDYTAWDSQHPYYDAKSDPENPRWYMVDLKFVRRAQHFVPLALLRHIASLSPPDPPEEIEYIGEEGVKAIKGMTLVNQGRLSVQRVEVETYKIIEAMADGGGWDDMPFGTTKATKNKLARASDASRSGKKRTGSAVAVDGDEDGDGGGDEFRQLAGGRSKGGAKRRKEEEGEIKAAPTRRSTRNKASSAA